MNYLIFRTDRIGDFLITSILINSIKRNNKNSKIFIVASNKNIEYIKEFNQVDKIFLLKSKNISDRINLYFELKKYHFDNIIISDKKNRSILFGLFLKAKNKIFNVSKVSQKKILRIFYKNVFLDNDQNIDFSIKDILLENCKSLNIELEDKDFHYLKPNQFQNEFKHSNFFNLENMDFILIHYDEKWEIENYAKAFKKASNLTDINVDEDLFIKFLFELTKKTSKKIFLSTGTINTKLINKLKFSYKKINNSLYQINLDNNVVYLFSNENFLSLSHLVSKCSLLIACHGASVHVASNYNVKILDIIEKSKTSHYKRITKHFKNHKFIYRDDFSRLSGDIINNL